MDVLQKSYLEEFKKLAGNTRDGVLFLIKMLAYYWNLTKKGLHHAFVLGDLRSSLEQLFFRQHFSDNFWNVFPY